MSSLSPEGPLCKARDHYHVVNSMGDRAEWSVPSVSATIRRALGRLKSRVGKLQRPPLIAIIACLWFIAPFAVGYLQSVVAISVIVSLSAITIGAYLLRKRDRPLTLWNAKPVFDINAVENATFDLSAAYDRYRDRLSLSRMTFEIANLGRIERESIIYIIAMLLYVCGLFYYVRITPHHPELGLDYVAIFLTTFGVLVPLGTLAAYFFFLRRFSDVYARFTLQRFNESVHRRIMYVVECIASRERLYQKTRQSKELLKAGAKAELGRIVDDLAVLNKSLLEPGFRVRIATIVALMGIVSGMFPLFGLVAQYVAGLELQTRLYLILVGMYSILAFFPLIIVPVSRARNLLEWNGVDTSVQELDERASRLMTACLGEESKSVLRRDFIFRNPGPRVRNDNIGTSIGQQP